MMIALRPQQRILAYNFDGSHALDTMSYGLCVMVHALDAMPDLPPREGYAFGRVAVTVAHI